MTAPPPDWLGSRNQPPGFFPGFVPFTAKILPSFPSSIMFFTLTILELNRTGNAVCKMTLCSLHIRSEEHTSELQSRGHLVCRLLLEKKNKNRRCITQCAKYFS